MLKKIYIMMALCSLILFSCNDKDKLGAAIEIAPDYKLPQEGASKVDNDRIQSIKDKYGSYFLYVVTQKDFEWTQSSGSGALSGDSIVLGNPQYVGLMLDYLNDIWLKYYPEEFKKGGGLPYRVMMADMIKRKRQGTGYPPGMEYLYFDQKISGRGITISGMNENLLKLTKADKIAKRNLLQTALLQYYIANNLLNIPASFYNVSDYVLVPTLPINAANPNNLTAYRHRGFLPSQYLANGNALEWFNNSYSWTTAKNNDLSSYLLHLTQRTDIEMEPYLVHPLIKEKFNLLIKHFKDKYNFDVRAMANDRY